MNWGITILSRFIPRWADKCKHFFKLLKIEKKTIQWMEVYM